MNSSETPILCAEHSNGAFKKTYIMFVRKENPSANNGNKPSFVKEKLPTSDKSFLQKQNFYIRLVALAFVYFFCRFWAGILFNV
jgi:hypothetical protein